MGFNGLTHLQTNPNDDEEKMFDGVAYVQSKPWVLESVETMSLFDQTQWFTILIMVFFIKIWTKPDMRHGQEMLYVKYGHSILFDRAMIMKYVLSLFAWKLESA